LHGLIFKTSIFHWQDQSGIELVFKNNSLFWNSTNIEVKKDAQAYNFSL